MSVLQFNSVKSKEMKDLITKEYYQTRKIQKTSLNAGNTIDVINARVVLIIKFMVGIVEWRK